MAKGNHVFNNFDKVIQNIFRVILADQNLGREFDAINGSGGDINSARTLLQSKFPVSLRYYNEIKDHPEIKRIHETQDDKPVASNDPNSKNFGTATTKFSNAVVAWALNGTSDSPIDAWRELTTAGFDPEAQRNYVSEAPKSQRQDRQKRCEQLAQFVKGELGRLVGCWLFALRADLQINSPKDYEKKREEWRSLINS